MSLNVYFKEDIHSRLLAGLILTIRTAQAQETTNVEHLAGVLCAFEYQAHAFGLDWSQIVAGARIVLGVDYDELLVAGQRGMLEAQ